jgi:pyridoxine 5-phosphate synthase
MLFSVNVDHVATIRQARGGREPDPATAAAMALKGGADGITVHLREDRRHIQDSDLKLLEKSLRDLPVEFNLEMAAVKEMIDMALNLKPDLVTLVPEKRAELTTEGGLNVKKNKNRLQRAVRMIQNKGIPVSLFINPFLSDIQTSKEINASMVEIHTGFYADAQGKKRTEELKKIKKAVKTALRLGFHVNAGHGLNYTNIQRIISIREIRGLYIGHSLVSKAVYVGMETAVREMQQLIKKVRE